MTFPLLVKNLLSEETLKMFQDNVKQINLNMSEDKFKRKYIGNNDFMEKIHIDLTETANKYFNKNNLVPSFAGIGIYDSVDSVLPKHVDCSPCTYGIDLCLYQDNSWRIYIEDKFFDLNPNEAVFYYGEKQIHWREKKDFVGTVCNVFFFYVDPDHWSLTEPKENHQMIRQTINDRVNMKFKTKEFINNGINDPRWFK
jgi:hypothetical protein